MCRSEPHMPVASTRTTASSAAISSGSGRSSIRTSPGAWKVTACMAAGGGPKGVAPQAGAPPPPGPERGEPAPFFDTGQEVGYQTAMDQSFVEGSFLELGPATVWMRMRQPLVAGEQPSALQRVLCAADSGNGVSAALDYRRYVFINTDLSVHLHRLPEGEWVCLEAVTRWEPAGGGLAD